MFVYTVSPIDHWSFWVRLDAIPRTSGDRLDDFDGLDAVTRDEVEARLDAARPTLIKLGWEGDMRAGPFVTGFPAIDGWPEYLIGFKQDNNGETFIISPRSLPFLVVPESVFGIRGKNWLQF
jgi:hypothetical protein